MFAINISLMTLATVIVGVKQELALRVAELTEVCVKPQLDKLMAANFYFGEPFTYANYKVHVEP